MTDHQSTLERSPGFWAGIMFAAYGIIAASQMTGAVEGPASTLLYFLPLALLWPLYKSVQAYHRETGTVSPAITTYNRRFLMATAGYMAGLGIAIAIYNRTQVSDTGAFGLALLPAIPVLGMIWAMARYITDESDEYLRHRAVIASLFGLALLLAMASVWGFMELFGVVPHAQSWLAFPIWAGGMGLGQCRMNFRSRETATKTNGA